MISRKEFLKISATMIGAGMACDALGFGSAGKIKKVGVQLFTIPQMVSKDFPAAIKLLSELGYREVEFFGPYPFSAESTLAGWQSFSKILGVDKHAFYGYDVKQAKEILDENKIRVPSAHVAIDDLRNKLEPAMESLSQLGVKYATVPLLQVKQPLSMDFFKGIAEEFNTFGEKMKAYKITFAYHNHGYEHNVLDGQVPMDYLIQNTDADRVKFEIDIFWMKAAGADPIEFLRKYPGRIRMMHVKNASEPVRFSGDGSTMDQYIQLFSKMADAGEGAFDLKAIINEAVNSGVKHFFVERDMAREAVATLKNSYQFLSGL
jgi:sugar phosphate isomerase/epimerase